MTVVVTQAECSRQTVGELECGLMKQAQIECRCMKQAWHIHHARHRDATHPFYLLWGKPTEHRIIHCRIDTVDNRIDDIVSKMDGCNCLQPLIRAKDTRGPMPETVVFALEHKLLRQTVLQLSLFQPRFIQRGIIDIHLHVVIQILIGGG